MKRKDKVGEFRKMWEWLSLYPENDLKHYMVHVVKMDGVWLNNCPLANKKQLDKCSGCKMLWTSTHGNLCTDSNGPLCKWMNTEKHQLDKRSFYAREISALAKKKRKYHVKPHSERLVSHRRTALGDQLPSTRKNL